MAKNRYGWQKRAKELARKQKHDDKILRRQGKSPTPTVEKLAEPVEAGIDNLGETALLAEPLTGVDQQD